MALKRASICGRNVCLPNVYVLDDINNFKLSWPQAKINITELNMGLTILWLRLTYASRVFVLLMPRIQRKVQLFGNFQSRLFITAVSRAIRKEEGKNSVDDFVDWITTNLNIICVKVSIKNDLWILKKTNPSGFNKKS